MTKGEKGSISVKIIHSILGERNSYILQEILRVFRSTIKLNDTILLCFFFTELIEEIKIKMS